MTDPEHSARSARTNADRAEIGRAERERAPLTTLAEWRLEATGRDALAILRSDDDQRIEALLPLRWARMAESPFAYFRGSAAVTATDLAPLPRSSLDVQLCGDAHIGNFGGFGTAERNMVFDVNDFDETIRGPFEWDVRRLATSVILATDDLVDGKVGRRAARTAAKAYRTWMHRYAEMTPIQRWYERIDAIDAANAVRTASESQRRRTLAKALERTSDRLLPKLSTLTDSGRQITSSPPLVVPFRDPEHRATAERLVAEYGETVPPELRHLLGDYHFVDAAMKVVGVGSVGTRCFIVLLLGPGDDPLFLQVKEARPAALQMALRGDRRPDVQPDVQPAAATNEGERVVRGQRLVQAAGDPFLGWASAAGRDFYVRQLRDMKVKVDLSTFTPKAIADYGAVCGRALARAHARTGDAVAIDAYLDDGSTFDKAMADLAVADAEVARGDYRRLVDALESGELPREQPGEAADESDHTSADDIG